jgi:hypothetical protein
VRVLDTPGFVSDAGAGDARVLEGVFEALTTADQCLHAVVFVVNVSSRPSLDKGGAFWVVLQQVAAVFEGCPGIWDNVCVVFNKCVPGYHMVHPSEVRDVERYLETLGAVLGAAATSGGAAGAGAAHRAGAGAGAGGGADVGARLAAGAKTPRAFFVDVRLELGEALTSGSNASAFAAFRDWLCDRTGVPTAAAKKLNPDVRKKVVTTSSSTREERLDDGDFRALTRTVTTTTTRTQIYRWTDTDKPSSDTSVDAVGESRTRGG